MITKVKISKVQKLINENIALQYKKPKHIRLKRNVYSLGSDTSVHGTGITLVSTDETYLYIHLQDKLSTDKKLEQKEALLSFIGQLRVLKEKLKEIISEKTSCDKLIVIEDTFLAPGVKSNPYVLKVLSRFGGVILGHMCNIFNDLEIISPNQARSQIGFNTKSKPKDSKISIKTLIRTYLNGILDLEMEDEDISDATCLAIAGICYEA